eukprot:96807-Chlamydomonas_euryale.AAC.1
MRYASESAAPRSVTFRMPNATVYESNWASSNWGNDSALPSTKDRPVSPVASGQAMGGVTSFAGALAAAHAALRACSDAELESFEEKWVPTKQALPCNDYPSTTISGSRLNTPGCNNSRSKRCSTLCMPLAGWQAPPCRQPCSKMCACREQRLRARRTVCSPSDKPRPLDSLQPHSNARQRSRSDIARHKGLVTNPSLEKHVIVPPLRTEPGRRWL